MNHVELEREILKSRSDIQKTALKLSRNKNDAEDLTQDAICLALASKGPAPGVPFPRWIHRIVKNRFISILRKKHESPLPETETEVSAGQTSDRTELHEMLTKMKELPPQQRTALLETIQDNNVEDIAKSMGVSSGVVRSWTSRARKKMKKICEPVSAMAS